MTTSALEAAAARRACFRVDERTEGSLRRRPRRRAASSEERPGHDGRGSWAGAPVLGVRTIGAPGLSRTWTVRELDTSAVSGAIAARCLVFENHEVVRRLWHYPAAWASLSDDQLERLADAEERRR